MKLNLICVKYLVSITYGTLVLASQTFSQTLVTDSTDINVVATIRPLHSIVARIMEGIATPSLLLDKSQSSHDATLKPSQAKLLSNADVIFWIGPELETFLSKPVNALTDRSRLVSLIDTVKPELLQYQNGRNDPHIWLSTRNARSIARIIKNKLTTVDPDNAQRYNENLVQFETKLDNLRQEIEHKLALTKSGKYLISHDALQYFGKQFSIATHSVFTGNEELTPSVQQIMSIRKFAQSDQYRCIFVEPGMNVAAIKSAITNTHLKMAILDPIGSQIAPGPDQYLDMMHNITQTIVDCAK